MSNLCIRRERKKVEKFGCIVTSCERVESIIGKWRRDAFAATLPHLRLVSVQPGQVQNNALRQTREEKRDGVSRPRNGRDYRIITSVASGRRVSFRVLMNGSGRRSRFMEGGQPAALEILLLR